MSIFQLRVNGTMHTIDVDGNMPLLWVLRDVLGLKGTKFGCGVAQCGACTVHIDGRAARSCITDVGVAALSEITTIEGQSPEIQACQSAWVAGGVPRVVFSFTVEQGKIVAIDLLADPEHLQRLQVAVLEGREPGGSPSAALN